MYVNKQKRVGKKINSIHSMLQTNSEMKNQAQVKWPPRPSSSSSLLLFMSIWANFKVFFYSPSKADIMSDCRVHELHRQTGLIELLLALGHVYTLQFTEQACREINDGTIYLPFQKKYSGKEKNISNFEKDYSVLCFMYYSSCCTFISF